MIPHNKPTLGIEEENAAIRVLKSKWISQGPEVESFEKDFCSYLNIPQDNAVAVANGSAALFLAIQSLNPKNKKISFPSYTCSVIQGASLLCNCKTELIDVAKNTPNIDFNQLKISDSDIAIIPHMYGIPSEIPSDLEQKIIEDCAQAIGSKVNNKLTGIQGEIGIFSFHATKMITSGGQGGMIVSKNENLIEKIRNLRDYGIQDDIPRLNFQMTDIQASIGRVQLKKLPSFIKRREEIFQKYKKSGLELLDIPLKDKDRIIPVRFRAIMKTSNPTQIIKQLAENEIRATNLIEYSDLLGIPSNFPNSVHLAEKQVSLPIYPSLTDEEVESILSVLT